MEKPHVQEIYNQLLNVGIDVLNDTGGCFVEPTQLLGFYSINADIYVAYIDYLYPIMFMSPSAFHDAISNMNFLHLS